MTTDQRIRDKKKCNFILYTWINRKNCIKENKVKLPGPTWGKKTEFRLMDSILFQAYKITLSMLAKT